VIFRSFDYRTRATFTVGATTYRLATRDHTSGGDFFEGALEQEAEIAQRFVAGALAAGEAVTLVVMYKAPPDGDTNLLFAAYRDNTFREGVTALVEVDEIVEAADGTTSTSTRAQYLTLTGISMTRQRLSLSFTDVEDQRFGMLYPTQKYNTTDWPQIRADDAGWCIPVAVGTALKFRCPQLVAVANTSRWWFGLCELIESRHAINGGSAGTGSTGVVTVSGDVSDRIAAGGIVYIAGSTANDGRYSVAAVSYSAPNTSITVVGNLPNESVFNGNLVIVPSPLAVYRNDVVIPASAAAAFTADVSPGSYSVWHTGAALAVGDGGFDVALGAWSGGGTQTATNGSWTATRSGSGNVSIAGSQCTLTIAAASTASIAQTLPVGEKGRVYVLRFTVSGSNPVSVSWGTWLAATKCEAGRTHQLIACSDGTAQSLSFSVHSSVASGAAVIDAVSIQAPGLALLRFDGEQIDFQGRPYTIQADVLGAGSRNVATEIHRLLQAAGLSLSAASKATAEAYATTHRMLVDAGYGRDGKALKLRTILDDLSFIARGGIARNASAPGEYVLIQDKDSASTGTLNFELGDHLAETDVSTEDRPASVAIAYRPSPRDPGQMQHTIPRNVTGGAGVAEEPRSLPYLRDHEAADRLLCYLALRRQYNRKVTTQTRGLAAAAGTVVTLVDEDLLPSGGQDFFVEAPTIRQGFLEITAVEHAAAIHTYTAGTLPTDAVMGYEPDYSSTPPSAPTALKIVSYASVVAGSTTTISINVQAQPPATNRERMVFAAVHNVTGEIWRAERVIESDQSPTAATIAGLRPGEVYQLLAYCVNRFGVDGSTVSTFDASGVGGGTSVTTFTAPGTAAQPGNVSSCSAVQGMGRLVRVYWSAVTNAASYVLERKVGAGAFAEVWAGNATGYEDIDVAIGSTYQYRVKARNAAGTPSASYATSGLVTPTSTVTGGPGGDIGSDTVETSNRTAVTGVSVTFTVLDASFMASNGLVEKTVSHGLGKLPVVGGTVCSATGVHVIPHTPTTTQIGMRAIGTLNGLSVDPSPVGFSASYVESELDNHEHPIPVYSVGAGDTATVYIW
jgi:hypothetical protein